MSGNRKPNNKEKNVTTQTDTPNFEDVDVDAPQAVEAEDTVATPETATADKPAKEKKESTRPPVPEGKVSPVQFAKILSEHLTAKARETDPEAAEIKVAPQVVYSYIKNNGPDSKNPFPAEKAEGRAAVVDPRAGLDWWDAKTERVNARATAKAEKDAKKAEKTTDAAPAAAQQVEVTEAE
jgi:hypothetical protein